MTRPMMAAAALAGLLAAGAAGAAPTHPLDGLQADEYALVKQILTEAGRLTEASRFPLIELDEPPKEAVLAWSEGDPIPRMAHALVKEGAVTYEARIDLAAGELVSWERIEGQPMLLFEEFLGAMELALAHPDFQSGLERRGLTPDDVFCLPLTAGNFFEGPEAGQRLMKVPCYVNPTTSNFYARPIEGLIAVVDLGEGTVLEVIDTGMLAVPEDGWGYTEPEIEERYGLRVKANPVELTQPGGANFGGDDGLIEWDMWRFRLRVDKRPGPVLSMIEAKDGDEWRSVLYQAHLSEVFVPYMDPDVGWYWRTYMDSGEYGFGIFLSPLRAGVDCPRHAEFRPVLVHDDMGDPLEIPDAICVFERAIGDPAWRHFEIFAQGPDTFVPAEGRPARELVVRTASEVGNYDYLVDYVFKTDGNIVIQVGSTGLDAVKGAVSRSMDDPTAAEETRYGTLIAPQIVAPNHDHYFNFRLDFDIDGRENSFMRTRLVPGTPEETAERRSFWVTRMEMPKTEDEATYRVDPANPAMYHVANTNVRSGLGHMPSYMIMPENSVAYSPFDAEDPPIARNPYVLHTFQVTPQDPRQRYAGGRFALASTGEDTLADWAAAGRSIDDRDVVVWYTMGFHHVPRMEDWPVMPTMWKRFTLKPFNFFDRNPSITERLPEEPS